MLFTIEFFPSFDRLVEVTLRRVILFFLKSKNSELVQRGRHGGTDRAASPLLDGKRTFKKRLSLVHSLLRGECLGEGGEIGCRLRMVWPVPSFGNCERLAIVGFRCRIIPAVEFKRKACDRCVKPILFGSVAGLNLVE